MTISERVAAGTAWLDKKIPGWWKRNSIDLSKFDMADPCGCVVGQLSPYEFDDAMSGHWLDLDYPAALELGFFAGHVWLNEVSYEALQAEWVRVITERREAAA